ncbi:MAG TPA: transporter [Burkholderiales bacterium]|nr:transporter [Burkholderiales bacterium]
MHKLLPYGIATLLALPLPAAASCGAAFCSINTSWDVQDASQEPGARFDLRYEHINQDQPRAGSRKVAFGALHRHHDEIATRNRNLLASIDYALDADLSFNAMLPIVHRGHAHIHNHMGAQFLDTWNFTGVGDARVTARRRLGGSEASAWGFIIGAKLPTGDYELRNGSGALAERSLQPGTGTTDAVIGAYYARRLPAQGWSWFVQPALQVPLDSRAGYRPGRRFSLDLGTRHEVGDRLALMLQLNVLHRTRDAGRDAEPADTGGSSAFLSPGASYALSRNWQVFGFVQLPVYQYVNGVQVTADRAVALGVGTRF